MIDRKKVIKGLTECVAAGLETACPADCPYILRCFPDVGPATPCMAPMKDALALLKEQEAKAGTWHWKIHGKAESGGTLGEAICDQCGKSTYATAVKGDLNYCPNCGAKMTEGL